MTAYAGNAAWFHFLTWCTLLLKDVKFVRVPGLILVVMMVADFYLLGEFERICIQPSHHKS